MPPDVLLLAVVALAVLVLVALVLTVTYFIVSFMQKQEERHIQAELNEDYTIKSRIVFSHQKQSEQPVVIINTRSIPLFRFFDNYQERQRWKRWVQKSFAKLNREFPVYIDGEVRV